MAEFRPWGQMGRSRVGPTLGSASHTWQVVCHLQPPRLPGNGPPRGPLSCMPRVHPTAEGQEEDHRPRGSHSALGRKQGSCSGPRLEDP